MAVTRSLFFFFVWRSTALAVTPAEKVIDLLKQLQGQVEEEGKTEAAQYDKYACFCKEQSDEKLYMIEKSTTKIAKLNARIGELDTEIGGLNAEITDRATTIDDLAGQIEAAAQRRASGHANYSVEEADMSSAIAALKGAIDALAASKSQMSGAKLDFAQVQALASRVLAVNAKLSRPALPDSSLDKATALTQIGNGQAPPTFAYHSNEIISTLEDLLSMFIQNKKELDQAEFDTQADYEKKDLNLKNLKKFAEKEKAEMEEVVEKKTEEKQAAEEDVQAETTDKQADEAFLQQLTGECETKATQWDQRSKTRADELVAIAGALKALEEGVAPSYGANKKLVDLQNNSTFTPVSPHIQKLVELQKSKAVTASPHIAVVDASKKTMSFLQLRGSHSQSATAALVQKVAKDLSAAAGRLQSSVLEAAAVRVQSSEDHFVKVRSIIKDLVARLEADAAAEATQKSFCDNAMAQSVTSRDNAKVQIETLAATDAQLNSEMNQLNEEIASLAKDMASLQKALNEATELRNADRTENEQTVATAREGVTSTELALRILNEFYNAAGGAFVQYVPPNSDREGKTVGDRAPEIWEGQYSGKQADAKGIVGILEVIKSDFERTVSTVTSEETSAQQDFEQFETDTNQDIADKTASKETKESRVATIKDELTQTADSMQQQQALLDAAEKSLSELKVQCVDGEETYAERVAKREKEIEALKEAHDILENWQG